MSTGRRSATLERDGGYQDEYATETGDRRPSEAVVDAVAAIADAEPASLTPLYDAIDPDALDALAGSGDVEHTPRIAFEYEGYSITVEGTHRVVVVEA